MTEFSNERVQAHRGSMVPQVELAAKKGACSWQRIRRQEEAPNTLACGICLFEKKLVAPCCARSEENMADWTTKNVRPLIKQVGC